MINIEISLRRAKFVKAVHRWFSERPDVHGWCRLAYFFHCRSTVAVPGFRRFPKFTKLIDLGQSEEQILAGFRKNTRYEVRRADSDKIHWGTVAEPETFLQFYDIFAATKERLPLDRRLLLAYWPHMRVTQAAIADQVLVMHSYLLDPGIGRATLLHSASPFRTTDDQQERNRVSRANRWLHFSDMTHLKTQGFTVYDFGGYAVHTENPELQHINDFKDSFGGQLVEESTYYSQFLTLFRKTKALLNPRLRED